MLRLAAGWGGVLGLAAKWGARGELKSLCSDIRHRRSMPFLGEQHNGEKVVSSGEDCAVKVPPLTATTPQWLKWKTQMAETLDDGMGH